MSDLSFAERPAQQPGPLERLNTGEPNCGPGLLQRLVRRRYPG